MTFLVYVSAESVGTIIISKTTLQSTKLLPVRNHAASSRCSLPGCTVNAATREQTQ
jgi:hypothetical protein